MAKILVIEDDPDLREFLKAALKIDHHEVSEATNGREGLDILLAQPLPDLVMVDWIMPVMDGATFLKEREQHSQILKVPVFVLSGLDKVDVKATNAQFVKKPIELDTLLKLVKEAT